jgi:HSP20 family molecular chaperone IbpA
LTQCVRNIFEWETAGKPRFLYFQYCKYEPSHLVTIEAQTASETEEKLGGRLVRRERYAGQQFRRFSLPQDIDDKSAAASYDNGVLSLKLPKKSGSVAKTLSIK